MRKLFFLFSFTFLCPLTASALTCATGDASGCTSSSEAASDCTAMGYSLQDIANCEHYLFCPFNTSYKICVAEPEEEEVLTECSGDKAFVEDCDFGGGIGEDGSLEKIIDKDGNTQYCVNCKLCDSYGYKMVEKSKTEGYTCESNIYMNYMGNKFQCCKSLCSNGKMHINACENKNGVLKDNTIDSDNCGTCLTCPAGWDLKKRGTFTSSSLIGYEKKTLNGGGTADKSDICIRPCEAGCTEGTYITSADQIKGSGTYCLGANITFAGNNGSYTFKPSGCSATLTISQSAWGVQKIVSYVNTIVEGGSDIYELELHAGGRFENPLVCGTSSQCSKNCKVKLFGNYNYHFSQSTATAQDNLMPTVSCSLESGNPTTKPILAFDIDVGTSGYLFSGSDRKGNCTINADNSCYNKKCKCTTKTVKNGTITSDNSCQQ